VVLNEQPSRDHFDPEHVDLPIVDADNVKRIVIAHPWYGPPSARMAPGDINVVDRRGKSIDAFTFGGDLGTDTSGTSTRVSVTSPAPILDRQLIGGLHVESVLAEEFYILLAERRARADKDLEGYGRRLARVEPLTLYAACLSALENKLTPLSRTGAEIYIRSLQTVKREIASMKEDGAWPSPTPPLEDLL